MMQHSAPSKSRSFFKQPNRASTWNIRHSHLRLPTLVCIIMLILFQGCGENSSSQEASLEPRVLNGALVDPPALMPQLVQVELLLADGTPGLCSGVVLDQEHVLTAGHCIPDGTIARVVRSFAGDFPVLEAVRHPAYRESESLAAIFHDLAILTTAPHPLPRLPLLANPPLLPGSSFTVAGFGLDDTNSFGTLRSGVMMLEQLTENHLISSPFNREENVNPCNGDSGAPAIFSFTGETGVTEFAMAGLVSSGIIADCSEGDVTIFSNLQNSLNLQFIFEHATGTVLRGPPLQ